MRRHGGRNGCQREMAAAHQPAENLGGAQQPGSAQSLHSRLRIDHRHRIGTFRDRASAGGRRVQDALQQHTHAGRPQPAAQLRAALRGQRGERRFWPGPRPGRVAAHGRRRHADELPGYRRGGRRHRPAGQGHGGQHGAESGGDLFLPLRSGHARATAGGRRRRCPRPTVGHDAPLGVGDIHPGAGVYRVLGAARHLVMCPC